MFVKVVILVIGVLQKASKLYERQLLVLFLSYKINIKVLRLVGLICQQLMCEVILVLLKNKESRPSMVDLLAVFLERNLRRAQIRSDELKEAKDGFMLNLLYCLLDLTVDKIPLDKVGVTLTNV